MLARCLGVFNVDAHGLTFVWHGFRHGGASRAYLRGDEMSRILTRGRWVVESSGRNYIPVSYTHLTLTTTGSVYISVGAGS